MEYNFTDIEARSKAYWNDNEVYKVANPKDGETPKPKYYVLDMFPYPSGAGLHVGHPLGYIASDIYARYKRLSGYNVLHPMGFDEFGLPAEQYAIETGQHPADTTKKNTQRYKEQLDNIGFSFDWSRKVGTSDPTYYKWTQWIFLQLFHSWYDRSANKAKPLAELIAIFEKEGNTNHTCPGDESVKFDAATWTGYNEKEKRSVLMQYRLAYQGYAQVWWCEALGTVLANDEVVNGVSERGGHPVERKNMRQWFLRITEYADRLLTSLDTLDWSDPMKEMQRNWIGKSVGALVHFKLAQHNTSPSFGGGWGEVSVFTTRPDTIFGVDFMVLAPEHELVTSITTPEQKEAVDAYIQYVKGRSERERQAEVKSVTGCFTGAHAIHPLNNNLIPIWISEYVLAGYGTGAIMGVPSGDERDHRFAKHFNIPITNIFGDKYTGEDACSDKTVTIQNSGFISGMSIPDAARAVIDTLEKLEQGSRKVNYRLRDAGFSRQRYWGEPFPIVYVDDMPYGTDEEPIASNPELNKLPVELPMVETYSPGPEGQGPLANIDEWMAQNRETNTMPGYAGSSWYFLRYMDPHNENEFASRKATDYWQQVDLYIGGTEHAVGHLLYSRMWTKALCDLGHIGFDEPFKKLMNQGMIQGSSRYIYMLIFGIKDKVFENDNVVAPIDFSKITVHKVFISHNCIPKLGDDSSTNEFTKRLVSEIPSLKKFSANDFSSIIFQATRVDVKFVDGLHLDISAFKNWRTEYKNAEFLLDTKGDFICSSEIEKMSKSKYNVVNPDDIVTQYGADTFRMYEMFLGPIEMSKPWDTKGIEGVHRFIKKMWRLYADEQTGWIVTNEAATDAELKILHKTIKKITEDMERFSFNTSVSQFMITVNELSSINCHKRAILEPLAILICPFAPHLAEELWRNLGNSGSVVTATYPVFEEKYVTENTKNYPIAINGKPRAEMEFALDAEQPEVEAAVLANETIQKWLEGKAPKKFIYVKGKMINVVV